jgi:carbon-monoxide dehydrogenase small subunit
MKTAVRFVVNRRAEQLELEPRTTLLEALRDELRLTGAKHGCGEGECGACTVLVDGRAVCSCLMLAVEAEGLEIVTIEGLAQGGELHPLQRSFLDHQAVQCGFCTPGMILAGKALLDQHPRPTASEVRHHLAGNICRCTGYQQIVEAVVAAAADPVEDPGKDLGPEMAAGCVAGCTASFPGGRR